MFSQLIALVEASTPSAEAVFVSHMMVMSMKMAVSTKSIALGIADHISITSEVNPTITLLHRSSFLN
jgi:hypothetical protein